MDNNLSMMYLLEKINNKKALSYIRAHWGKKIEKKRKLDRVKKFFESADKTDINIDDFTWIDLTMDEVYKKLDRNMSTAGEFKLYSILRNPVSDKEILEKRNITINEFQNNKYLREKIQIILYKLGKTKHNINSILFDKLQKNNLYQSLSVILATCLVLNIIIAIITRSSSFIMLIFLNFLLNMFFHHKMENLISERASAASYAGMVVNTALKITKFENESIKSYTEELVDLCRKCKKIGKSSAFIGRLKGLDVIADYIFIAFLIEEINYFKILSEIEKNKSELLKTFNLVGEIDALISIASYRKEIGEYSEPIFVSKKKYICGEELKHPLIDDAIPNPILLKEQGMLITGSNMSGKSTYLRTVALNALFAQTIYTCLAKKYEACFFNIVTSIDPEDNIIKGKSYYLGEAESILRVVKSAQGEITLLSMIDEIFRGTNPIERISAAEEILDYLNNSNAIILAATHDIELTEMLHNYKNYYFREHVSENELTFDYMLKEGVSPTRNAIRILKYLGYPKDITDRIDKRIDLISK
ncbi:MutS-related protein [Clostridium sediminicola]|uniref:MutS-related protein n=1 Tax=Clostridium sediminicola TaxID=3114879 RepID=UPI003D168D53